MEGGSEEGKMRGKGRDWEGEGRRGGRGVGRRMELDEGDREEGGRRLGRDISLHENIT